MQDHIVQSTSFAANFLVQGLMGTENKIESYQMRLVAYEDALIASLIGIETNDELMEVLEPLYQFNSFGRPSGPLPSLMVTTILANEVKRRGFKEDCENVLVRWVYFAHSTRLNEKLNS